LESDKVILVNVPDVSRLEATSIQVQARALALGTYYRMDTTIDSGGSIEWPLTTVIDAVGLHSSEIGIFGRTVDKNQADIFVPVSVTAKGRALKPQHATVAVFRSAIDIEDVRWRVWTVADIGQLSRYKPLEGNAPKTIRAGEPIRLSLPSSPYVQKLQVAAKMANSDEWLNNTLLTVFVP
jgi:hypothetical protein